MYKNYKDVAEFRLVYVQEAHASDSNWSVPYAVEKGIKTHKDYNERCSVAKMLADEQTLMIPIIVEKMDDKVTEAYDGKPTRVFIVRKDGLLGVAAARGPKGYAPAMVEANAWLAKYKETGEEPELSDK
jgi:hypothetical protein